MSAIAITATNYAHAGKGAETIDLGFAKVGDDELKNIDDFKTAKCLHVLGSNVTDKGLGYIGQMDQLESLHLVGTQATDAGLKEIAKLKTLRFLHLIGTKITDKGLPALAGMKQLEVLDVRGTPGDRRRFEQAAEGTARVAYRSLVSLLLSPTNDADCPRLTSARQPGPGFFMGRNIAASGFVAAANIPTPRANSSRISNARSSSSSCERSTKTRPADVVTTVGVRFAERRLRFVLTDLHRDRRLAGDRR